jgi:hypothetical protein
MDEYAVVFLPLTPLNWHLSQPRVSFQQAPPLGLSSVLHTALQTRACVLRHIQSKHPNSKPLIRHLNSPQTDNLVNKIPPSPLILLVLHNMLGSDVKTGPLEVLKWTGRSHFRAEWWDEKTKPPILLFLPIFVGYVGLFSSTVKLLMLVRQGFRSGQTHNDLVQAPPVF